MLLYYFNWKGLPLWPEMLFCGAYLFLCNCSIEQELWICTDPTVHRGSRSIIRLFLEHGTRSELPAARSGCFNTGKDPVINLQEVECAQGRSGQVRNISLSPGFEHLSVQLVAQSLYQLTNRAH